MVIVSILPQRIRTKLTSRSRMRKVLQATSGKILGLTIAMALDAAMKAYAWDYTF